MRIAITGKDGQLGWELCRAMAPLGETIAFSRAELDLAKPDKVRGVVRDLRPDLIVNAAAYTQVDKAEEEVALAEAINALAPGILAEEAKRLGARLIHYSTDYVFDGLKRHPYQETDASLPINYYGRSKLAGEQAVAAVGGSHLILRTSWIYGARGRNFMLTILNLAHQRQELRVVSDQLGVPNWSRAIAETTGRIAARWNSRTRESVAEVSGVFHLSAVGETNWFEFARTIIDEHRRIGGKQASAHLALERIVPITTSEYPTAAARPRYSVLSSRKLSEVFAIEPGDWREQLALALQDSSA
ncbi:MAG TPA: dTDP-4-dehydrorhamnose reductase [Candidatus Binataceae bacterium]|jgi:dTDP-4-dehydrorhamnose reductase